MTKIRALTADDRSHFAEFLRKSWGSTQMSTLGHSFDLMDAPGFVAEEDGRWQGYVAYVMRGSNMEVATLESLADGQGIGSALLAACVSAAVDADADRLWLVTTNDNVDALRFYQRRGFVLVAVHPDAVTRARKTVKPELPLVGFHNIPLRDEIELELPHAIWSDFIERYSWPG